MLGARVCPGPGTTSEDSFSADPSRQPRGHQPDSRPTPSAYTCAPTSAPQCGLASLLVEALKYVSVGPGCVLVYQDCSGCSGLQNSRCVLGAASDVCEASWNPTGTALDLQSVWGSCPFTVLSFLIREHGLFLIYLGLLILSVTFCSFKSVSFTLFLKLSVLCVLTLLQRGLFPSFPSGGVAAAAQTRNSHLHSARGLCNLSGIVH